MKEVRRESFITLISISIILPSVTSEIGPFSDEINLSQKDDTITATMPKTSGKGKVSDVFYGWRISKV